MAECRWTPLSPRAAWSHRLDIALCGIIAWNGLRAVRAVGASFSHRAQGGGIWPDGAGMPDPQPQAPPTKPAPEPSPLGSLIQSWADFVGSTACPWGSLGMPRRPPSPVPRAGQTARPGNRKGHAMTEPSVSFAGNLTDQPQVR